MNRKRSCLFCGISAIAVMALAWGCNPTGTGGGGDTNVNDNGGNVNDNSGGGNTNTNTNDNGGGGGSNTAPTADAGVAQQARGGDVVQLDGTGSSDADGDTLSVAWVQTAGAPVTLDDAASPTPTFDAPSVNETLTFELTVDDGNGGSDTDSVDVVVVADPSVLFVVNNGARITSYSNPAGLNGEVIPDTSLPVGGTTQIFQPRAIVVTPEGDLIISSQNDAIVSYFDAFTATGEMVIDQNVEGNNTLLDTPISFAYDEANDRLYVGNASANDGILVFDDVSVDGFDGDVPPSRTFGPADRLPFGTLKASYHSMAFDTEGNLYVVDQSGLNSNFSRILVFANPETAEDLTDPVRTIEGLEVDGDRPWGQVEQIAIDANNTLYVVDSNEYVAVLDDAMTLDSSVTPDRVITIQIALADLEGVVVGADGTGYLADKGNASIYILADIVTLDGGVVPGGTLDGFDTGLRSPRQLFLFEPQ